MKRIPVRLNVRVCSWMFMNRFVNYPKISKVQFWHRYNELILCLNSSQIISTVWLLYELMISNQLRPDWFNFTKDIDNKVLLG